MRSELVLSGGDLGVNFFDKVNDHRDNNEKAGAADGDGIDAGKGPHHQRQDGHNAQKEGSDHGQAKKYFGDVGRGGDAGTDAGDKSPASLQIF